MYSKIQQAKHVYIFCMCFLVYCLGLHLCLCLYLCVMKQPCCEMLLTLKVAFELHEGILKCNLNHLCLHSIQATEQSYNTACKCP